LIIKLRLSGYSSDRRQGRGANPYRTAFQAPDMTFQATLIRCCLVGSVSRIEYNATRDETRTMKKPSKTAAELEASIKVEIEDICDWPTDMTISVQPDGDSWTAKVVQEGSGDDVDRREMVEQIAARLKAEFDLKG
jgi:hypothetical protein